MDADRLEGAGRRFLGFARTIAGRTPDDRGQFARPLDRPGLDDGARDPPRLGLLAKCEKDVGDHRFIGVIDETGSARPIGLHSPVERPLGLEAEPASLLVDLPPRPPELQQYPKQATEAC